WAKEAKDWGYTWAKDENKHLHKPYVPVYRYARDIIGCLNNWVDGWVDWNMVLDRKGGPNWANNWCVAPILVDTEADEVYMTPLYYTLAHFSKFIRPGAVRIGFENENESLQVTATQNPDGSIAVIVFNPEATKKEITLKLGNSSTNISIDGKAIQTVMIPK
ncbi:MAG: glycoside hydrolase family 30 beta sandwich domain-containing protein, partial [Chitinophagales bacterium]